VELAPAPVVTSTFRATYLVPTLIGAQLVEICLGVFQIGGVEALGEPVIDVGEHRARLIVTRISNDLPLCFRAISITPSNEFCGPTALE
jgi:hypothetical protein